MMFMDEWLNQLYNPAPEEATNLKKFVDEVIAYRNSEKSRLKSIMNLAAERQRQDYDFIPAVTGGEGTGKSTLLYWLCKLDGQLLNMPFNIDTNFIYNPTWASVVRTMQVLPKMSAVNVDEAIRTMYVRNWNARQQREMNTFFATVRKRNIFCGLAIPHLFELDSFFKNFRIIMWIHIFEKGKAGIFVKDPNPFNADPFNTRLAKKIIDEKTPERFSTDDLIRTLYDHVPNFITWFKYPDMPPAIKKQYLANCDKYLLDIPQEEETSKVKLSEIIKVSIATLYESSEEWTIPRLAAKFKSYGVTEYKVRQIISEERRKKTKVVEQQIEEKAE